MLSDLPKADRLQLLRFVCSFAWTDLEVSPEERKYILRLAGRLDLAPEDRTLLTEWLLCPPRPEQVDPLDVPREHRALFVKALHAVAEQDGAVNAEERTTLRLFERLTE